MVAGHLDQFCLRRSLRTRSRSPLVGCLGLPNPQFPQPPHPEGNLLKPWKLYCFLYFPQSLPQVEGMREMRESTLNLVLASYCIRFNNYPIKSPSGASETEALGERTDLTQLQFSQTAVLNFLNSK